MKPIVVVGENNPIIMEVVGRNGRKLKEYVDKWNGKSTETLPYYELVESASL